MRKTDKLSHMMVLAAQPEAIRDNVGFFEWIAEGVTASRDRIEEVIGRGNLKWALLILFVSLAVWYVRRRPSS